MKVLKFSFSVIFFLCSLFLFCFGATAAENSEDAFVYDELNIVADRAVLTGQTQQMRVEEYSGTGTGLFHWTSSNPAVISCTSDGRITGVQEGQATIKVKALFGDGEDSITVYCAKSLSNPKTAEINQPLAFAFQGFDEFHFPDIHLYFYAVKYNPIAKMIIPLFPFNVNIKINVKGLYGSYFYVEYEKNDKICERFMLQRCFDDSVASEEVFKQISKKNLDVYAGTVKEEYCITTNYKGEIEWSVSDESIIEYYDEEPGKVKIKGLKPGIATISATADGNTLNCTVHSIYMWPQNWTGAANRETCVYIAEGNTYKKTSYTLSAGQKFIVKGDMGDSSGWAYGVSENDGWGYIPISHISTKGTISQYNNMTTVINAGTNEEKEVPWIYPIKDTKFKHISSPYGWRNGSRHLGFDINKGEYPTILNEEVVAPFTGKVVFVNKEYNYTTKQPNYGYCIILETTTPDPVSGNKLRIAYMHLNEAPSLKQGDTVEAGKIIGKIGTTGNSTGPHLHLEINNKGTNFAGTDNSDSFDKTINPIFFYMNSGLKDSLDSSKDEYWYNDNK